MIKSGYNGASKYKSLNVLETVLSHLKALFLIKVHEIRIFFLDKRVESNNSETQNVSVSDEASY